MALARSFVDDVILVIWDLAAGDGCRALSRCVCLGRLARLVRGGTDSADGKAAAPHEGGACGGGSE